MSGAFFAITDNRIFPKLPGDIDLEFGSFHRTATGLVIMTVFPLKDITF